MISIRHHLQLVNTLFINNFKYFIEYINNSYPNLNSLFFKYPSIALIIHFFESAI